MLGNILKDKSVADQGAERELLRLQETMDGPSFVCVNLYPEIETDKKEEIPLMLFAIDNVFRELTEKHMLVQTIKYDNYLSCIFNVDFTSGGPGGQEPESGNGILKEYSAKTGILEMSLARLQEKMKEYFDLKESFLCENAGAYRLADPYALAYGTDWRSLFKGICLFCNQNCFKIS